MPTFPHMPKPRLRRPDALALAIAAVALLGAATALYRQSAYGVMISADSVHYIAMARNALDGHGFMTLSGLYRAEQPPLTQALYAVFSFGVFDPLSVVGPLNAAALAVTVFTVGAWLRRRLESRLVVVWACLAVALEIAVVRMFDFAWSEPQFILLCAMALYWADRHLEDGRRSSLAWAAAFSALACLSRYAGPAVVAAVAGMILLRRGVSLKERLAVSAAYSAASLAPLCVWMARNWLNTGFLTSQRVVMETALEHVAPMLDEMAKWWLPYVPIPGAESAAAWAAAAAVTLVAALGMFALFRWLRTGADAFVPLAIAFAFAHAALTLMAMRTGISGMDRYVIPTYVPLLVAVAFALDRALAWMRGVRVFGRAIPAAALVAALAAWTAYGGFIAASDAYAQANGNGYGRMARAFHESEVATFLRERRGADVGLTFSNLPLQAYLASDGRGLFTFPPHWSEMEDRLESRRDAGGETVVVWFADGLAMPYGAAAFWFAPGFEPLGAFQDGDVFRLSPGYPPRDPRAGALILDSYYDVYLNDGNLTWVRQPCSDEDARGFVELWAQPVDPTDADAALADFGNFYFRDFGAKIGDLCVIRRALPDYPIKTVGTGQAIPGEEWFYRTRIRMPLSESALAYYRSAYESAAAGALLASADFDVYLDGGELFYLKEPCSEYDTRGRFGLSVFPKDAAHFPEGAGGGHQSMNFDFENHGAIFDGKCMARRTLPEYAIKAIETGRWLPDERDVWWKFVQMPLSASEWDAYEAEYAALSDREPLARADFDLHLDSGALVYIKEACADDDMRGRFLLKVYPKDAADLPAASAEDGFEYARFGFARYGARFGGKCMMRYPLPGYPVRAVETGRLLSGGEPEAWARPVQAPLDDSELAAYRETRAALSAREPLARAGPFDLHLNGGELVYLKPNCGADDARGRFWVNVHPVKGGDIPQDSRAHGHESIAFVFPQYGVRFDGGCLIAVPLPDYMMRTIETVQHIPGEGDLWKTAVSMPLTDAALAFYRDRQAALSARAPLARSDFDVHVDGGDLVWIKRPCAESDTRGRFLLSAFPADPDVLPEDAGDRRHIGLNFDFIHYGAIFDDACMIRRPLPGYAVKAIQTGQWLPGESGLWATDVIALPLSDAARAYYRDEYDAVSSRAALARSGFDVYADGGDLVYLKRPCAESDTVGRFSLNLFPAFPNDIPESRRETGHDTLDFDFDDYGIRFGDSCMMRRPLPDYPVRAIETWRRTEEGGVKWKTAAPVPLSGAALAKYRDEYNAISSREPLARADFDVYLDGGDLIYLKRPCILDDTRGRFLLSVFPSDRADLPQGGDADAAHQSVNFDFFRYGAIFDDACMIRRPLPAYPIAAVEMGQWLPGERALWSAKAAVGE